MIWSLVFSPDGNYIDFVRAEKSNMYDTFLYRMPVLGGTPRLVMRGGIDGSNSYSPDGTHFAFLRVGPESTKIDLLIAKADGTDERVLATRPYVEYFFGTAWSPDGKTIVFSTSETDKRVHSVLWAVSVADGSVHETYSTPDLIGRPRWLPDGRGLLVPVYYQGLRGQLWYISFPKGDAIRLTNDLMNYDLCCLDLTRDGKTLVDAELTAVSDLWLAPAGNAAKAKQITAKEPAIGGFSWMPNGSIVFANGDGNLVVVKPDGSGHTLLTPDERPNWDPSACGDGRYHCLRRRPGAKDGGMAHGPRRLEPDPDRRRDVRQRPTMFAGRQVGGLFAEPFLDTPTYTHHGREAPAGDCTGHSRFRF